MNLYNYLMNKSNNTTRVAEEAAEAYKRFRAHGRMLTPVKDCDPFVFAFIDHGYQAFTFKLDDVVNANGAIAIVTGWVEAEHGWRVCVRTARGEGPLYAEELKPAEFPDGLIEILRGRVHGKVDEAFA